MDLSEKRKEKALKMASQMADEADERKVEEAIEKSAAYKNKPVIGKIWDKVLILIEIIKSPLFKGAIALAATGALLYLASPIDLIPDIIAGIGLIDDVAVITTILAGLITNIKKDPSKALKFVDSLPEKLKVPAASLFGLAGGAYAGAKAGAAAGKWLKDNSAESLYDKINPEHSDINTLIEEKKREAENIIKGLLAQAFQKAIKQNFMKRCLRSLSILVLFLLAILLTLSPVFGNASTYIASALLLSGYAITLYAIIMTIIQLFPYIRASIEEKSVTKGCERILEKQFQLYTSAKKVLIAASEKLNIKLSLSKEEMMKLIKTLLKTFYREVALFVIGTGVLVFSFILLRHALIRESLNLTIWQMILFPYFS